MSVQNPYTTTGSKQNGHSVEVRTQFSKSKVVVMTTKNLAKHWTKFLGRGYLLRSFFQQQLPFSWSDAGCKRNYSRKLWAFAGSPEPWSFVCGFWTIRLLLFVATFQKPEWFLVRKTGFCLLKAVSGSSVRPATLVAVRLQADSLTSSSLLTRPCSISLKMAWQMRVKVELSAAS